MQGWGPRLPASTRLFPKVNKQSQVSMGNTNEVACGGSVRAWLMPIGRRRVRMAVRMREERTELTCGSVVAVYHNLLVSEMGSRRTVRVSLCSGLPVGPTRGRWLHGVRKWIGGAEGERHVSGSKWRETAVAWWLLLCCLTRLVRVRCACVCLDCVGAI
mgnify:CR=1 FL=1